jgi:MinD-like ATPase involved in chromosome partitioning or flagellar assembly
MPDVSGCDPWTLGLPEAVTRPGPQFKRSDVYYRPVVDGRAVRDNTLTRLRDRARALLTSALEREELMTEQRLRARPAITRTNTVATISPKGGVGKTTTTFLLGNLLTSHLKLRVLAVDLNPDFGTLAALAPDRCRSENSLAELLRDESGIGSAAELRPYVSALPTGLHVLAAPVDADVMRQMSAALYDELLTFLEQFYEVILLDLGTGVTDPIAQFAIERADQAVVVTTAEWITATNVLVALRQLQLERATLVLNQAVKETTGDSDAIAEQFRKQRLNQRIAIPYDQRLRTMLDSGTYSLPALGRPTRVPIKRLGLAVASQLV